jgi:hypothetical protein
MLILISIVGFTLYVVKLHRKKIYLLTQYSNRIIIILNNNLVKEFAFTL